MNLAIDVGNTLVKTAVFDRDEIIWQRTYTEFDKVVFDEALRAFPALKACIIASVRDIGWDPQKHYSGALNIHILGTDTKLPVRHQYKTMDTLGPDRIAGVVAANHMYPRKNVLLIETGTCITYDLIDAEGVYHGGGISPGIQLRLAALHNFTDKLPLVKPVYDPELVGNSTETSIQSGVINGIKAEVKGIISAYERIYENLTIILSGGNLDHFDKNLKNNIFAVPNIVLSGLNIILNFNDKN
jgi:type III pantothenate kinase